MSNETSLSIVISVGRSQVCVRSVYPEVVHLESILDSFEEIVISRKPTDKENTLEFNYRQSERAFNKQCTITYLDWFMGGTALRRDTINDTFNCRRKE